jgi:hypothetical protein
VENTNYSLSWTHDWLDRFNTTVSLGSSKDDYTVKPGVVGAIARNDDTKTYGVAANYQMRRWLILMRLLMSMTVVLIKQILIVSVM